MVSTSHHILSMWSEFRMICGIKTYCARGQHVSPYIARGRVSHNILFQFILYVASLFTICCPRGQSITWYIALIHAIHMVRTNPIYCPVCPACVTICCINQCCLHSQYVSQYIVRVVMGYSLLFFADIVRHMVLFHVSFARFNCAWFAYVRIICIAFISLNHMKRANQWHAPIAFFANSQSFDFLDNVHLVCYS